MGARRGDEDKEEDKEMMWVLLVPSQGRFFLVSSHQQITFPLRIKRSKYQIVCYFVMYILPSTSKCFVLRSIYDMQFFHGRHAEDFSRN